MHPHHKLSWTEFLQLPVFLVGLPVADNFNRQTKSDASRDAIFVMSFAVVGKKVCKQSPAIGPRVRPFDVVIYLSFILIHLLDRTRRPAADARASTFWPYWVRS